MKVDYKTWMPKGMIYAFLGAAVAALQAALKHLGYDPTWIDGEAGTRTRSCIMAFQAEQELEPDGICGKDTWEKIMN